MSRLASIGPRAVHQPLTLAIYDQLEQSTDWDYVAGSALASLTAGNTLNVTSRHHKVTIVGSTIDNIADAAGASEGQLAELYFTSSATIRNNAGGAGGNIRTIAGADVSVSAGQVVTLVYDGSVWREVHPVDAAILSSAATQTFAGAISTGPTSSSPGGGGQPGVFIAPAGFLTSVAAATGTTSLAIGLTTDAQWRLSIDHSGRIAFGPGGSTAADSFLGRLAAAVLGDGGTSLSTGPTSGGAGGGGTAGVFVAAAGSVFAWRSSLGNAFAAGLTTDSQNRFTVDTNGQILWGPGGSTVPDTTFARGAAGGLVVGNNIASAYVNTSAGAGTWTPTWTNGLVQRYNMTATGTLTIGSPGTPPTGNSAVVYLIIHNASGGTITLSWNAIFNSTAAAPANGQGTIYKCVYNPGTAKWAITTTSVE